MKSARRSARNVRELDKPKQNKTLSMMLLLPEPFGPEIVVNPFSKGISIFVANDLKLSMSICFMYISYPTRLCIYYTPNNKACQSF